MDELDNSNGTLCLASFTEQQLRILGISQAVVAMMSTVACILVLGIIVIFKKYTCQTQRLIVYLTIAVLLLNIGYTVRGFGYNMVRQGPFCSGIAFYTQYNGGCVLLAVFCIIIEMFIHSGVFQGQNLKFDKFYFPAIFLLPLLVDWIPFINHAYGPTKTWCWIRSQNVDTCDLFLYGLILQYVLWFVPVFIAIIVGTILYIISYITIARQSRSYTATLDPTSQQTRNDILSEIKQYKWYLLIFLIFNGIPFVARVIVDIYPRSQTATFALWVIAAVLQATQGCVIAWIFTLDPATRKRLTLQSILAAIKHNILNYEDTQEYPIVVADTDSRVKSWKVNHQKEIEHNIKLPVGSLNQPLII